MRLRLCVVEKRMLAGYEENFSFAPRERGKHTSERGREKETMHNDNNNILYWENCLRQDCVVQVCEKREREKERPCERERERKSAVSVCMRISARTHAEGRRVIG